MLYQIPGNYSMLRFTHMGREIKLVVSQDVEDAPKSQRQTAKERGQLVIIGGSDVAEDG